MTEKPRKTETLLRSARDQSISILSFLSPNFPRSCNRGQDVFFLAPEISRPATLPCLTLPALPNQPTPRYLPTYLTTNHQPPTTNHHSPQPNPTPTGTSREKSPCCHHHRRLLLFALHLTPRSESPRADRIASSHASLALLNSPAPNGCRIEDVHHVQKERERKKERGDRAPERLRRPARDDSNPQLAIRIRIHTRISISSRFRPPNEQTKQTSSIPTPPSPTL